MTLEVRDLSIALGAMTVVDGVSFAVSAARTLGIVGESGAGKSLTSMSIPGLLDPAASVRGSIRLQGSELIGLDHASLLHVRGRQIGVVFQEPRQSFNPAFTVGEQIAETLRWHESLGRRAAHARAVELLGMVGIDRAAERAGDYPHAFSGGMLQRAMIAMAIACRPVLLIADEPTSALDVTVQAQILKLLKALQASLGMAMLFVSHDMGTVAQVCDEVAVMYAGQIVERCDALELFARPRHPYTEGLLRSVPDVRSRGAELHSIPGGMPLPGAHPPGCRFSPRCPYVLEECRAAPVALFNAGKEHQARCIRAVELDLRGVAA
ncbi:MAG: ABC transporter ATP-binding protein [Betaproteobacteria bacterium]